MWAQQQLSLLTTGWRNLWNTHVVVAAVHFVAIAQDYADLLDYLGEPDTVSLHPWPVVTAPLERWTREQALCGPQVMVAHRDFGPVKVIRPGDPAMAGSTRAGLFNRFNWNRLAPQPCASG